jgi:hypothetical protein
MALSSRTHIRDSKRTVKAGVWKSGAIPKSAFPLFREPNKLGPNWKWRSAVLTSDTHEYRLLIQLRTDKPAFKAWLAVKIGDDWAVMGRLESHGNHGGLHCHMQCAGNGIAVNEINPADSVSVPHWKDYNRRPIPPATETEAWGLALRFFRAQTAEVGSLGI